MRAGGSGLITDYPLKEEEFLKLLFHAAMVKTSLPVYIEGMWSAPDGGKAGAGLRLLA